MGFGGISIWSLLLILVIVLLLFGTKKLRNIGTDLGGAIKGFKSAMNEGEKGKDKDKDDDSPRIEAETRDSASQESEPSKAGQDQRSS